MLLSQFSSRPALSAEQVATKLLEAVSSFVMAPSALNFTSALGRLPCVDINLFGLGINSDDVSPFLGSDFHMPFKWAIGEGVPPGPRAKPGMTFALFGDGLILATVTYCGCSRRSHRWEHRPSEDGLRHDYGAGWVLDLDPNTWKERRILCEASGQSYRYGYLSLDDVFTQIIAAA